MNSKIENLIQKLKGKDALIRPIVLYGAETWALRISEELRIAIFESSAKNVWPSLR